jgi:drug/metabolite transporter (DMT)-like permease
MKFRHSLKAQPLAWVLVLCFCLGVGIFPLLYKKLADTSNDNLLTLNVLMLYALLLTFLTSLPSLKKSFKNPVKIDRKIFLEFLLLGILTVGGNAFFLISIKDISPGIAQLVQRSELVFVLYLSWIFFAEKISFRLNISIIVILIGMYFLKQQDQNLSFLQSLIPIFWATASGFCFALMQVMLQATVRKYNPVVVNTMRFIITIIFLFSYPQSWIVMKQINTEILFWGFWSALIGPFCSRLCYSYACRKLPVSTIVLFTPLAPILTIIFQWIFLDIVITQIEFIGSIILLVGMYAAIKSR